ncbi:probable rRNA maturation factor [Mycoplasma sp. CAG:776]|nr:probable rRNA maturation factor [Mycoplasma sp. CAG:776]
MRNTYEINDLIGVDFNYDYLDDVIKRVLKHEEVKNAYFSIIFVDLEEIQRINKEYRGLDRITDVISFALEDTEDHIDNNVRILGDIYICIPQMKEQANVYGHSIKRELSFLTVHGLLHLLGYDHMNKEEEKIMFGLQELVLNEAGITR